MTDPCPERRALLRFLEGELSVEEAARIESHVEGCGACDTALAALADNPAGARATVEPGLALLPGVEVRGELGHGGMGVVYRVFDPRLRRELALKTLRAEHAALASARQRFIEEMHITAQLQHPGIVPVHDTGALPDGRPYYLMKVVKGRTLAELLRARPHPAEGLLSFVRLVGQVGEAIGYAHSLGVIHRDLKPANIMVGAFGEVQVMDWGLAKALGGGNTSAAGAIDTPGAGEGQTRGAIGTWAYMAPEQAERGDRATAASDVFALGAILCEVLTGQPPYAGSTGEALWETVSRGDVREAMARLTACAASADLIALTQQCLAFDPAQRPRDGGAVARTIAGALASAEARARHAERDQAATEARALEQRKRWRTQRRLGTIVLAVVLLGAGVAGWQWWRAEAALQRVTREEGRTRQALDRVSEEQKNLTVSRAETVDALRRMTDERLGEGLGQQPRLTPRDEKHLDEVRQLWDRVAATRGDTAEARALRAEALDRLGRIWHLLGQRDKAEAAYRDAIAGYQQLTTDPSGSIDYTLALARAQSNLGLLHQDHGRSAEAQRAYDDALGALTKLGPESARHADLQYGRAAILLNRARLLAQTRPADALPGYAGALAILRPLVKSDPRTPLYRVVLATTLSNLGNARQRAGQLVPAEGAYAEAMATWSDLLKTHPDTPAYLRGLAQACNDRATQLGVLGKSEAAVAAFREALMATTRLSEQYPSVPDYRHDLANTASNLGLALLRTLNPSVERVAEATRHLESALAHHDQLTRDYPKVLRYAEGKGKALTNVVIAYMRANNVAKVEQALAAGRAVWAALVKTAPDSPDYRNHLAATLSNHAHFKLGLAEPLRGIATMSRKRKLLHEAEQLLAEAAPHHALALKANKDNAHYREPYHSHLVAHCDLAHERRDHTALARAADHLAAFRFRPVEDRYNAACYLAHCVLHAREDRALSSLERSRRTEEYADRAMAHLKQAIQAGYAEGDHLAKDKDLDPLRSRADFQQLLRGLKEKKAPTKKP